MQLFVLIFQILLFVSALLATSLLVWSRYKTIRRNILLGKDKEIPGDAEGRKKNMLLMAFGQKRMFDKPVVGFLHLLVYAGFILINIEVSEIVLDGLTGQHRLFSKVLGGLYPVFISLFELLGLGVTFACAVFLLRRNFLRLTRFHKPELNGWPQTDANLILTFEIVLMFLLYTMNATDSILQSRGEAHYIIAEQPMYFLVSMLFVPLYKGLSTDALIFTERIAWWLHILGIMGFSVYVTYSKHLHIFLAFPNTYYADPEPKGKIENMDVITQEVKIALGMVEDNGSSTDIDHFGAKDVRDLSWKNLMDAYACTECGRCTAQCPQNQTGKKLSPRKIMMDVRDRADELGDFLDNTPGKTEDGKSLFDYISKEELNACNTCNACVEACPVNINPLDIILQLRRHVAMDEANVPDAWKSMLSNIQNNGAPWAFSASDRFKWADEMIAKENS